MLTPERLRDSPAYSHRSVAEKSVSAEAFDKVGKPSRYSHATLYISSNTRKSEGKEKARQRGRMDWFVMRPSGAAAVEGREVERSRGRSIPACHATAMCSTHAINRSLAGAMQSPRAAATSRMLYLKGRQILTHFGKERRIRYRKVR